MLHQFRGAGIREADANRSVSRIARSVWPSNKGAGVRSDRAAVEAGHHISGLRRLEIRTTRSYTLSALGLPIGFEKNRDRNSIFSKS